MVSHHVSSGYEVVKAIEACGSRSGDTAFDVMIADCGQLNNGMAAGEHAFQHNEITSTGTAAGASASATPRGTRGYATAVRGVAAPSWVQSRGAFAGAAVLQQGVRCVWYTCCHYCRPIQRMHRRLSHAHYRAPHRAMCACVGLAVATTKAFF